MGRALDEVTEHRLDGVATGDLGLEGTVATDGAGRSVDEAAVIGLGAGGLYRILVSAARALVEDETEATEGGEEDLARGEGEVADGADGEALEEGAGRVTDAAEFGDGEVG